MSEKHDFEGALQYMKHGGAPPKRIPAPFRGAIIHALRLAAALENIDEITPKTIHEARMIMYTREFLEQLKKEIDNDQR